MARPRQSPSKRFWAKVEVRGSECWPWLGATVGKGYGAFMWGDNRPGYAHRFSYELHFGPIPDGEVVRHRCDNPNCVNPEHLVLGTQAENIQDSIKRDRWQTAKREQHLRRLHERNKAKKEEQDAGAERKIAERKAQNEPAWMRKIDW